MNERQVNELKAKILEMYHARDEWHPHGSDGGSTVYGHVYISGIEVWADIDTATDTVMSWDIYGTKVKE